ncbi:Pal1 family protein [Schizosaccharomyces pombe]
MGKNNPFVHSNANFPPLQTHNFEDIPEKGYTIFSSPRIDVFNEERPHSGINLNQYQHHEDDAELQSNNPFLNKDSGVDLLKLHSRSNSRIYEAKPKRVIKPKIAIIECNEMAENPPFWNQKKAFERKVSSKESFNMLGYDKIDKLDSSNSYLGDFGVHHDGPFDPCSKHRNLDAATSPIAAFSSQSEANSLPAFLLPNNSKGVEKSEENEDGVTDNDSSNVNSSTNESPNPTDINVCSNDDATDNTENNLKKKASFIYRLRKHLKRNSIETE